MRLDVNARTLALIDIENLCGGTAFSACRVRQVRDLLVVEGIIPPDAHCVVGASCQTALLEAGLGWPGARLVWRKGPDGADHALADVALNENVAGRFGQVVICSGDSLFTTVASCLQAWGVAVRVAAVQRSLSRVLQRSVVDVRFLQLPVGRAA